MFQEEKKKLFQIIRGFPCPVSERYTRQNIEDAMDLVPGDGDLVLASYPKTGTTWLQYIILQIKSKGEFFPSFDDATFKVVPFVELTGVAPVLLQNKPRFYKHHIAYNFVQRNDKSKVIYVYRHPEDTIVSFYHFALSLHPDFPYDFDQFFVNFVTGQIAHGSYFQHVLSFYKHREDENLLMVSYEKLQTNERGEILRIAKFLGEEHYQDLVKDEMLLQRIIERTSFEYMKKNLQLTHPDVTSGVRDVETGTKKPTVKFFRKGIVGDGKSALADKQRQILKEAAERILKGTTIMDEWYSH